MFNSTTAIESFVFSMLFLFLSSGFFVSFSVLDKIVSIEH